MTNNGMKYDLCNSISKDNKVMDMLRKSKAERVEYYSKICNDGRNIYIAKPCGGYADIVLGSTMCKVKCNDVSHNIGEIHTHPSGDLDPSGNDIASVAGNNIRNFCIGWDKRIKCFSLKEDSDYYGKIKKLYTDLDTLKAENKRLFKSNIPKETQEYDKIIKSNIDKMFDIRDKVYVLFGNLSEFDICEKELE